MLRIDDVTLPFGSRLSKTTFKTTTVSFKVLSKPRTIQLLHFLDVFFLRFSLLKSFFPSIFIFKHEIHIVSIFLLRIV